MGRRLRAWSVKGRGRMRRRRTRTMGKDKRQKT
jgi:hypothetical protein